MFRKSYWKKRFAPVLAGALVISSLLVPPGHAFAADPVTSEEQTVSPEAPEVKDVTDSTDAATTDANLTTPDSVSDSVSEDVRVRYYETHQHLQDNRTDYVDLRNIKEALFFLAPLFHGSIQFEKDIWSVIAKTQRLLKESSPVAE